MEGVTGQFHLVSGEAPSAVTVSTGQVYPAVRAVSAMEPPRPTAAGTQLPKPESTPRPTAANTRPPAGPAATPGQPAHFVFISMNDRPEGLLAPDALMAYGISIAKGAAAIQQTGRGMVVPKTAQSILLLSGPEKHTELDLEFATELKIFQITRIGVELGASLPKWRMDAFDPEGNRVDSVAEWEFGMPESPKRFSVTGQNIVRVVITTDNEWNGGTYATYSSLPIISFGLAY